MWIPSWRSVPPWPWKQNSGGSIRRGFGKAQQSLLGTPSLGFFMVAELLVSERPMLVAQLMITYRMERLAKRRLLRGFKRLCRP